MLPDQYFKDNAGPLLCAIASGVTTNRFKSLIDAMIEEGSQASFWKKQQREAQRNDRDIYEQAMSHLRDANEKYGSILQDLMEVGIIVSKISEHINKSPYDTTSFNTR